MRKPKEDEKVTCPMDHHGGAGADLTPTGCWNSTTPEGRRITYGVIPEHQFEGKPCEYTGQVVKVTIASLEADFAAINAAVIAEHQGGLIHKDEFLRQYGLEPEKVGCIPVMEQMDLFEKVRPEHLSIRTVPEKIEPEVTIGALLSLFRELDVLLQKLIALHEMRSSIQWIGHLKD